MQNDSQRSRRKFLKTAGIAATYTPLLLTGCGIRKLPSSINSPSLQNLPQITHGIQIGDVITDKAIIWSRADRPSKLLLKYSFNADFSDAQLIEGPLALAETDYTAKLDLSHLPAGKPVFVEVMFQDLNNPELISRSAHGQFKTAPTSAQNIRFLWSGDTCGQGWGINPDIGGMTIYETMRVTQPDFFIHCGDNIYADSPIKPEVVTETGVVWHNLVTPEVSKAAETLNEFRGRYKYNLLDDNLRRFNAEVPVIWLWDDHEVTNNWSPTKDLKSDNRYTEKNINTLISNGTKAAMEYAPMRYFTTKDKQRIYRQCAYGPLLDIFVLDMRSYRAGNSFNRQTQAGPDTAYLGQEQLQWLKTALKNSKAVWKVMAADLSLGLQIGDGEDEQNRPRFENVANGDSPPLGREFEIAELLSFIKQENINNLVWFTAEVHYCAALYYEPSHATFKDFTPFWEFISGPLNAGSFGTHALDNTLSPQIIFEKPSPTPNLSPLSGLQYFGQVDINSQDQSMTVALKDMKGSTLFTQILHPQSDVI